MSLCRSRSELERDSREWEIYRSRTHATREQLGYYPRETLRRLRSEHYMETTVTFGPCSRRRFAANAARTTSVTLGRLRPPSSWLGSRNVTSRAETKTQQSGISIACAGAAEARVATLDNRRQTRDTWLIPQKRDDSRARTGDLRLATIVEIAFCVSRNLFFFICSVLQIFTSML